LAPRAHNRTSRIPHTPTTYGTYHLASLASMLLVVACAKEAEPRGQIIVTVGTDLPTVSQLGQDPEISPAVAVDTLRVDILAPSGDVALSQTFVLPSEEDWPVSFGLVSSEPKARIRIRAFRGESAGSGLVLGAAVVEPPSRLSVDRLIEVSAPDESVQRVGVVLRGECIGIPATFGASPATCIDASTKSGAIDGDLDGAPSGSTLGTWPEARGKPCTAAALPNRVCIPGSYSIVGDDLLAGIADGKDLLDASPPHPVIVRPFWLDRTEFTVGRLRELVKSGAFADELPRTASEEADCTWLGPDDPTNDTLPVNCIPFESARSACLASGGDLPSEARFEHASRGRGQQRIYPWGDERPTCCAAAFSRIMPGQLGNECEGPFLDPVGSHPKSDACAGIGDESRDGVLDLGGNVDEYVLDAPSAYTDPCWTAAGVPVDPVCTSTTPTKALARGGCSLCGMARAAGGMRQTEPPSGWRTAGFRCAYSDTP